MTIEILYFEGCPNHELLCERLPAFPKLARIVTEPTLREITTQQDAEQQRFLGSPTLRVNGHDVEPTATTGPTTASSAASTAPPEGLTGLPTDRWILAALTTP